jgi:SSS family solute:Na+ symporter
MEKSAVEIVVILIYFVGMILVGIVVSRKVKNSQDFLVAGRRLPLWLVTATLFATWWGGGTILGGSGEAFHSGFHGVMYDPYGAGLTLILAGFLFMKIVHDAKVNTAAQFFSCRYGQWASTWSGILMVPTYVLWSAVQLVAIGKVFNFVLGWPYEITILIGTAIILIYTILGGMLAVSWTDFFQVIILLIGLIILFPLAIKFAGGWAEVRAATPAHFFKIFPAQGSELAPPTLGGWAWWWGALLGVGLGTLAAPDLYQRAIVAKSGKVAMQASLTSGVGYWVLGAIPVWLAFVAITLIANGGMPAAMANMINEDSETLILVLSRLILPPALAGIFIASLLAMIMSSGDSALFAPAAVLANDIWKPLWEKSTKKQMTDRGFMSASRWSVVIIAAFALLIGRYSESMYDLLVVAFQLLYHVLFFPIILGVYWKRANAPGAVAGMVTGFVFIMVWMALSGTMFPEPEWASTLVPGGVGGVIMVIVSLITQKRRPPQPLYTSEGEVLKWPELATK